MAWDKEWRGFNVRLKINNIEDGVVLQFGSRHNFSAPLRRHENCSFRGAGLAVDWSSFRLVNAALLAVVCCGLLLRTDCGSENYKIKFFNISCSMFSAARGLAWAALPRP